MVSAVSIFYLFMLAVAYTALVVVKPTKVPALKLSHCYYVVDSEEKLQGRIHTQNVCHVCCPNSHYATANSRSLY